MMLTRSLVVQNAPPRPGGGIWWIADAPRRRARLTPPIVQGRWMSSPSACLLCVFESGDWRRARETTFAKNKTDCQFSMASIFPHRCRCTQCRILLPSPTTCSARACTTSSRPALQPAWTERRWRTARPNTKSWRTARLWLSPTTYQTRCGCCAPRSEEPTEATPFATPRRRRARLSSPRWGTAGTESIGTLRARTTAPCSTRGQPTDFRPKSNEEIAVEVEKARELVRATPALEVEVDRLVLAASGGAVHVECS